MKLSAIKLNPDNPRFIKDDKFQKLCKSILEFPKMMELRPIVVDDSMTILGGNMRYRALQEIGKTEIPDEWVKKASELTDKEKERFIIADNIPFGEWDMDGLANQFDAEDLKDWGFDDWIVPDVAGPDGGDSGGVPVEKVVKCPKCGEVFEVNSNAVDSAG